MSKEKKPAEEGKKRSDSIMAQEIKKYKKDASRGIKAIDSLLENPLFSETGKEILQSCKKRFQKVNNKFKEVETDELGMIKLWAPLLDPEKLSYAIQNYNPEKPLTVESFLEETCFIIAQQKGRPSKVSSKALQIIIYKLLEARPPKHKSRYVQWAKALTASIINDFFERWRSPFGRQHKIFGTINLPKLTAKDIDSCLHSSS